MRSLLLIIYLGLVPATAVAQGRTGGATSRQTPDSVFGRALSLNNDQRGAEARALVDSMLRAAPATSAVHADALFWKGVLAESEQVAEESYKKIVLDFPLHRRAEESLMRLAQLDMMRGNRIQAQRYLDRIVVEHPYGQFRARASYWRARLFFEENELDRACAELGTARARVADNDAELKTEIDYAAQRCPTVPVPALPPAQRGAGAPPAGDRSGAAPPARGARQGGSTTGAGTGARAGTSGVDSGRAGGAANQGKAKAVEPPKVMYSVQAAAFPAKVNADAFMVALRSRGYDVRLVEGGGMYRVRMGMFPTREAATVLAQELKAKGISEGAYVVEAEGR